MKAVDCQGLAGAFTLGAARSGFHVVTKKELPGAFGLANVERNASLINKNMTFQEGPWTEWEPEEGVDLVFGNPPCSGFSLLNTSAAGRNPDQISVRNHRGWDSPINDCMWALVEYGARVNGGRGPLVLAMESVQQAYKKGRNLMQMLRDRLEDTTGRSYNLTHLLVSGSTTGAPQMRHRYYMVLTRANMVRFTAQVPMRREPLTYADALSDLLDLDWNTYDRQAYKHEATTVYQDMMRSPNGVTDHMAPGPEVGTKHTTQVYALLENGWPLGGNMEDAARKYYNEHGRLPVGFDNEQIMRKVERHEPGATLETASSWHMGFHQPRRVPWNKAGYVVTGSGGFDFIHPSEDRFLTVREVGRLQGFPDTWSFDAASSFRQSYSWIGKGVPVPTGQWVADQIRESLKGSREYAEIEQVPEPAEIDEGLILSGVEIGDRERLIDLTYAWKGKVQG